jgi:polysaccharide export outer membrane protein
MKLLVAYFLLGCSLGAPAQVTLQRRGSTGPEYALGNGDQIVIHVTDLDDISDKPLRIDPNGFIDLPLAGRIQAKGLSLEALKAELKTKLSKYITNPQISINLVASDSQPVSVIGEVNTPGVHQLTGSRRLLEVLSMSGGLKPDAGPTVMITRQPQWGAIDAPHAHTDPVTGYSTVTLSMDELMSSRVPQDNLVLKPDDVVSVPKAELIYVVGNVHKAGGFQLSTHETITLTKAISLAEGLTPDNAAGRARILRAVPDSNGTPKEIPVDIDKIFAGKAPDVQLYANDVLFVPHSRVKATSRRAIDAAIGITTGLLIYR